MASSPLKLVVNNVEDEETLILKPDGSGKDHDWLRKLDIGTTFLCMGRDILRLDEFKVINKVDSAILLAYHTNPDTLYTWFVSQEFSKRAILMEIIRTE